MNLRKIIIENFKGFKGKFSLDLNNGVNLLVGNNETGKSTILEAINLALSGVLNGRYLRNELSQYLFNIDAVNEYLDKANKGQEHSKPYVLIEVFFEGKDNPMLRGNGNKDKEDAEGVSLKIEFDERYNPEYEKLIEEGDLGTLPIEYYKITWKSFARDNITSRSIPIKSVLIDSSTHRFQNGSDLYISRIIKNNLEDEEKAGISRAYRKMREDFMNDESIMTINKKLQNGVDITSKDIKVSVDLSTKNAWETTLMTYLDEVPFHQIGKGEQCIVKTNLALAHKKSEEANVILLEEPENHLSHTKLNEFLRKVSASCEKKQIIISTHSNYVANKLGLENLILLNNQQTSKLSELRPDTQDFFKKLPGFETLRMVLSKKTILVEGPSDELIVQKAYMKKHEGRLPIEDGIDVISVRLSFLRFLEIATKIKKQVAVVTDNDGDYKNKVEKKYKDYAGDDNIEIFADRNIELNTLEPQFVNSNTSRLERLCDIFEIDKELYDNKDKLIDYMEENKTNWALKVFNTSKNIKFPDYINKVIAWCDEE
jgi:putative ATP-dependent endonuclease of OLD family